MSAGPSYDHYPTVSEPPVPELDYKDEEWLGAVTEEAITPAWLQAANDLMYANADPSTPIDDRLACRDYFYEELISLDRPESPLHDLYARLVTLEMEMPPIDYFVGLMRVIHSAGASHDASRELLTEKLQLSGLSRYTIEQE